MDCVPWLKRVIVCTARKWFCGSRKKAHHNNDCWKILTADKKSGLRTLSIGKLRGFLKKHVFSPVKMICVNGEKFYQSCALDKIYAKILSIYLTQVFGKHYSYMVNNKPVCRHLKLGHKSALRDTFASLTSQQYRFFYKTDVKSYYASVNHKILLEQIYKMTQDIVLVSVLKAYLKRLRIVDGVYHVPVGKGLLKNCSLSPVLAVIYLASLDKCMSLKAPNIFYLRFQDDILILSKTKSALRRAKLAMYKELDYLKLELRPEKTQIGTIGTHKLSFLGYDYIINNDHSYLTIGQTTYQKYLDKKQDIARCLYEKRASFDKSKNYSDENILLFGYNAFDLSTNICYCQVATVVRRRGKTPHGARPLCVRCMARNNPQQRLLDYETYFKRYCTNGLQEIDFVFNGSSGPDC